MSNRNFDNRVIIQRLQQQTYARNLYQTNMNGQSLISNPQNSDSTSSRLTTFVSGAQTDYFRGLLGAGETVSLGGIFGISPFVPSMVPLTPPTAPTITGITDGNQQLVVTFTAPTSNGGSSITDYEYSTDNGGSFTAAGSIVSPLTITGLTNGTTYLVVIRAVNSIGNGAISNMVEGTPATVPTAPTILLPITDGNTQLTVTFTASASTGGSVIQYYEYSLSGGAFTSIGSTVAPFTITGLINGTPYTVVMRAHNQMGDSVDSNSASGTPATVPSAPNIGTLIPGNQQLIVPFTPPTSTGGSNITGYRYLIDSSGNTFIPIRDISGNTFTISGLINGTSYTVVMRAVNRMGDSVDSNSASGIPVTVPGIPTNLSITSGNRQLTVNFTAPSNGGSAVTNYEYSIDASGNFTALDPVVDVSPITIPNSATLSYDTTYTVYIRAVNGIGNGSSSAGVSGTTLKEVPDIYPPPQGFIDLGVGVVEVGIRNFISFMPNIVNTVLNTTQGPYYPSEIRIVSSNFFYVRFENLRYQDPPNYRNYEGSSIVLGNGAKTSATAYFDFFVL